jgi:hypothetical protein
MIIARAARCFSPRFSTARLGATQNSEHTAGVDGALSMGLHKTASRQRAKTLGLRTPDWSPTMSATRRTSQLRYFIHGRDRVGGKTGGDAGRGVTHGAVSCCCHGETGKEEQWVSTMGDDCKNLGAIVGLGSQGR